MPTKNQWVHVDGEEKIYPSIIKQPPGRSRNERIRANDEQRKKYKCHRCSGYGHQQKNAKIWHRKINHQQVNEEKEQKHVKITNQSRAIYFFRTKWSKLWHLSFSFFGYCYMEFLWLFFWYDFLYRNGLKFWHFIFYLND
ncbi:hypothetical protein Hdeb2414_s0024g00649801 [Helianthus debilis subsp. tardiflorus]